jgi:hypothetical protein
MDDKKKPEEVVPVAKKSSRPTFSPEPIRYYQMQIERQMVARGLIPSFTARFLQTIKAIEEKQKKQENDEK